MRATILSVLFLTLAAIAGCGYSTDLGTKYPATARTGAAPAATR